MTLSCDNFSDFPCFWWPWQFWGILVRHCVECPSMWICLIFFSWLNWGLGLWRGRPQRWSATLITSCKGCMPSTWFITEGVNLDDPAYVAFTRLEMDYFSTNSSLVFREASGERFEVSDLRSGNINSESWPCHGFPVSLFFSGSHL